MSQTTLLITREQVKSLLDMPTALKIVEQVYRSHGEGKVVMPTKVTLDLGEGQPWPPHKGFMNAMPAYLGDVDIAGIKCVGGFKNNYKIGLPYISAMILLINPKNGTFLAAMDGAYITAIRTGAASAVCAKVLARKDASVLGIIGAGVQGRMHLRAFQQVFKLKEVRVFDIKEGTAEKYREEMTAELGLNILPRRSYQEVVEGADVICTVTIGDEPMVKKEWLKKGSLIISVGSYQELDPDVTLSADKIVVDHWGQASHRGELAKLVEAGKIGEKNIHAEIGEILSGKKKGREREDEDILAVPIGLGSVDIGCAFEVYRKALDKKIGTPFSFI
jgi:ornithine cyclodeaminase/alanine dehydrogenase